MGSFNAATSNDPRTLRPKSIALRGNIGVKYMDESRQQFQGCSIRSSAHRKARFRWKIVDSITLNPACKYLSTNEPLPENDSFQRALSFGSCSSQPSLGLFSNSVILRNGMTCTTSPRANKGLANSPGLIKFIRGIDLGLLVHFPGNYFLGIAYGVANPLWPKSLNEHRHLLRGSSKVNHGIDIRGRLGASH